MCGIPCHDRVVENIRSLRAHGIDTRLNVSLTEYNSADLEKILKTAKELGVHVKASSYMYPPTRYDKSAGSGRLTAEQAAEVSVRYDTLRFTDDEFRGRAENMRKGVCRAEECPGDPTAEGISCRAGNASFWLTWEGKMLPCGLMKARSPIRLRRDLMRHGTGYAKNPRRYGFRQPARRAQSGICAASVPQ